MGKPVEAAVRSMVEPFAEPLHEGEYTLATFRDIKITFNNLKADSIEHIHKKNGL